MTPQITFPNTHGKDTAIYALNYQRALLNSLAHYIESAGTYEHEQLQILINLSDAFTETAFDALKDEEAA